MIHLDHAPALALLLVLGPLVLLLELRADGPLGRRLLRAALRTTVAALLLLAWAGPSVDRVSPTARRRLVVAVERSGDMGAAGLREARSIGSRARAEAVAKGWAVSSLSFTDVARDTEAGTGEDPDPAAEPGPTPGRARPAAGLGAAGLRLEPGESGEVLLLASGRGDLSGLGAAARALEAAGLAVVARALPSEAPPRSEGVVLSSIDAPARARGPFDVRARVAATGPVDVELRADGHVVTTRALDATRGPADVVFEDLDLPPGAHELAIEARPRDAPTTARLARRLVLVEGPPRVLLSVVDPRRATVRRALSAEGWPVDAVEPPALVAALDRRAHDGADLRPEVVVLDAASARALGEDGQRALVSRVKEGLGLVLLAGEDAAAWDPLSTGPLVTVLPLVPRPPPPAAPPPPPPSPTPQPPTPFVEPKREDAPGHHAERRPEDALPISLLLVLDRSGSMEGPKLEMAIEAARRAAAALSKGDRVGVVTFADDATLDVPPTTVSEIGNLGWSLLGVKAGGNTDIYAALLEGARVLAKESAPIRHLVLLTDGHHTGREAVFGPLIGEMAKQGITITAVGLGPDHDDTLLRNVAMWAPRGRYVPAATEDALPTILTNDTLLVREHRSETAKALGLVPEASAGEKPPKTPDAPRPTPPPPTPPAPEPKGPDTTAAAGGGAALAPLVVTRPHEATEGLAEPLPRVAPPRPSDVRAGAALLLARETTADGASREPVLAAGRPGLGRVLALALPDSDPGLQAWDGTARLLVQMVRSVRAPEGALSPGPLASVLYAPDGERLRLDAPPGASAPPVSVRWETTEDDGGTRTVDLGEYGPDETRDLLLPPAPPGRTAVVTMTPAGAGGRAFTLTYLARGAPAEGPRAGDRTALAEALGPGALARPLLTAPVASSASGRRPCGRLVIFLAILLLPLDVAAHRHATRGHATRGHATRGRATRGHAARRAS